MRNSCPFINRDIYNQNKVFFLILLWSIVKALTNYLFTSIPYYKVAYVIRLHYGILDLCSCHIANYTTSGLHFNTMHKRPLSRWASDSQLFSQGAGVPRNPWAGLAGDPKSPLSLRPLPLSLSPSLPLSLCVCLEGRMRRLEQRVPASLLELNQTIIPPEVVCVCRVPPPLSNLLWRRREQTAVPALHRQKAPCQVSWRTKKLGTCSDLSTMWRCPRRVVSPLRLIRHPVRYVVVSVWWCHYFFQMDLRSVAASHLSKWEPQMRSTNLDRCLCSAGSRLLSSSANLCHCWLTMLWTAQNYH